MAGKSILDQVLDTLEKWEGESSETKVPEPSPSSEEYSLNHHKIAKEEKTRLLFWAIVCVIFIMTVPFVMVTILLSEVAGKGKLFETISITMAVLCYIIYFVLFTRALSRYLTLSRRSKGWLWITIHPFFALIFVIYLIKVDKSEAAIEHRKQPAKKKISEMQSDRFQKKKDFFDFTPDDRFKR